MAKKKAKSNNKKQTQPALSKNSYIKTRAAQLPWGKCYINSNWKDTGLAAIFLTRQMGGDKFVLGSYIVDKFCLGVKDTSCNWRLNEEQLEEALDRYRLILGYTLIEESPDLLQNIIYGAIEYAESLGFEPHKDFNLTEYILDPADSIPYIDIEFGKDGKPFYIEGPHDNAARIIEKLTQKVGADNFTFIGGLGNPDFFDEDSFFEAIEEDDDDDYDYEDEDEEE